MKIALLTGSISRTAGGMFTSVRRMAQELHAFPGLQLQVLSLCDAYTDVDRNEWRPIEPECYRALPPQSFGWAPALDAALVALDVDVVCSQGLWMYTSAVALRWHHRHRRPHVVSPRGMLDSWALKNSAWKKKIAGWLYENRNLGSAACIHALCESEYQSIRAYGLTNPVCIIPNGVDLPSLTDTEVTPPWEPQVDGGKNVMLFLGRIHPKKGLENLIRAWSILKANKLAELEQWHLVIAGWSQGGHENDLKRLANEMNLRADVSFAGPLYDTAKDAALRAAKAFILPSFSEGLPMAVLEAWAYGLPVIMTRECNIPDGFEAGAALDVRPDVESITEGLKSFVALSEGTRERMGLGGLELAKSRYSWPKIASQMIDVCKWVLGQGDKPDCVRLN